jgi:putative tryptophan/tyrosine transport system substrate-binding protein
MLKRRDFITLLGGAAAWPLAARAQQPAMPVIGYLINASPEPTPFIAAAFRKGLSEMGFVEGRNITIEYRYSRGDADRLPELAADLVRRKVAVIASVGGRNAALAAKAATTTIPIVFEIGDDPVENGLVTSFNRPGGNVTGITAINSELSAKRLGILCDLVPGAMRIGALSANTGPAATLNPQIAELNSAAAVLGRNIEALSASNSREIEAAFASFVQKRIDALVVNASGLLVGFRVQIATAAARHAIPTIYSDRHYADAGGLMSYGSDAADQFRLVGVYVGRVLKGEKPADLPVMRPSKFEFVINLQTARTLGIEVPASLLARADEVIE